MAKRVNPCLKVDGLPKPVYADSGAAWAAVRNAETAGLAFPGLIRPYDCPRCGNIHIGKASTARSHRRNRKGAW